ncbi:MAG: helix-turn-helix domain-containing protein, partial [Rhodanobacter sp.]
MTLGTRLHAARKVKGLSLRDVEKLVGVSASTISRL